MIQHTDKEIAQQLQALEEKIKLGINSADSTLEQAQKIQDSISQSWTKIQKTEAKINDIADEFRSINETIQQWQSDIQENYTKVITKATEIDNQDTLEKLQKEIQDTSDKINKIYKKVKQIDDNFPTLTWEIQQRLVGARELAFQITSDRRIVAQIAQQIEENANEILQVQSAIHQLHEDVVSFVNEIAGEPRLEQLQQEYETVRYALSEALQRNRQIRNETEQRLDALQKQATVIQQRFEELMATAQSALVTQAVSQIEEVRKRVQLREADVLNELRTLVEVTLTDLGGQVGLERLQRELQEGHALLSEIQRINQQLQSGITAAITTLQDTLQANSAVQEGVSTLEVIRSEVSHLALQVKTDKEAVQAIRVEAKTTKSGTENALIDELRGEIGYLQTEVQRLQSQTKKQQRFHIWLCGTALITAFLALLLALLH